MPMEPLTRNVMLAERFGCTPLDIEDGEADRWLKYLGVMGIEGEVRELGQGVPDTEPLMREGDA